MEQIDETKANHTLVLDGKVPSTTGKEGREYQPETMPKTVEELIMQIQKTAGRRTASTTRNSTEREGDRPSLPSEWEQCHHEINVEQDDELEDKQASPASMVRETAVDDDIDMQPADHGAAFHRGDTTDQAVREGLGSSTNEKRTTTPRTKQTPLRRRLGMSVTEGTHRPASLSGLNTIITRRLADTWDCEDKWGHGSGGGAEQEAYDRQKVDKKIKLEPVQRSQVKLVLRPQQEQEINGRTAAERLPNTEQKAQAQGAAKTTTSRTTSPKRKLPTAKEAEDRPSKERRQETRIPQGNTRQEARSESPNKRSSVRRGSGDSSCRQQYIHLFLEKTLNKTELEWKNMTAEDGGIAVTAAPPQLPGSTGITLKKDQSDAELTDRSYKGEECRITKILPATNEGKHFNAWMALVGGTIVDVAATGHCGWIAGYASLKNIAEGLLHPGSKLADDINLFKKDVRNGMLTNLQDEFAAYPSDLDTGLEESGIRTPKDSPFEVGSRYWTGWESYPQEDLGGEIP
ncbi:hypothetical protein PInf_008367 [Phytophthora infestans]|nr:hypothetical protein PInf_008367 [Phytophthora infestans]